MLLALTPTVLLAHLLAAPAVSSETPRLLFRPPGAWVQALQADLTLPPSSETSGGIDYLLVDDQVRSGPGAVERYHHYAERLLTPSAVESGSEVRVDFDPSYQQLVLHSVTIHREGGRVDALGRAEVKVVQRERELDRRLFDGRVTAVLFLRDIRQGDIVEVAWTLRGANPVFGGRWAGRFPLAYRVPVRRLGVRVLSPVSRPFAHRVSGLVVAPTMSQVGELVDRRWHREAIAAIATEDDLPPGVDPFPSLEVSEWASWSEVRAWAEALYVSGPPSAMAKRLVDRWQTLPDDASRVQAALRFAQDEVRYLGFELGVNSHRPHAPSEVLARGFGDCKDKSLLLVSLLGAMGLKAAPALVNTEEWAEIEKQLPSPLAFDHVIVQATVGGRVSWLEPTRSLERSPLGDVEPPPYQRALVLGGGEGGLTSIPDPGPALLEVVNTYRVTTFGAPVQLEVVTTYSGRRAVSMRHVVAESTVAELQRRYLEYYARREPKVTVAQPMTVTDPGDADRVVITEHYQLPPFGDGEAQSFDAESIESLLGTPRSVLRTLPLRIAHPVVIRERIQVELPGPPRLLDDDVSVTTEAAKLSRRSGLEGHTSRVDFEYRSLQPAVAAVGLPKHLEALRDMRRLTAFDLKIGLRDTKERQEGGSPWVVLAIVVGLITGGLSVIGVMAAFNGDLQRWRAGVLNWGRRRAFRSKFELEAGEGPAVPIAIGSPAEATTAVGRIKCQCGMTLAPAEGQAQAVRYDGRELLAHALSCRRCGARRQAYFEVKA